MSRGCQFTYRYILGEGLYGPLPLFPHEKSDRAVRRDALIITSLSFVMIFVV